MQTFYDYKQRYMVESAPGLIADSTGVIDRIYLFNSGGASGQTIAPLTVGGTIGTETFTITVTGNSAVVGPFVIPVEVTAEAGDDAVAVALRLAMEVNANETLNDLLTASSTGTEVTLALNGTNTIEAVTGAATGSATLTAAPTITPPVETPVIPYGYVTVSYPDYSDTACSVPNRIDTPTILGISVRRYYHEASYPYKSTEVSGYPFRAKTEILRKGKIWVEVPSAAVRGTDPAFMITTGQIVPAGTAFSMTIPGARFMESPNPKSHTIVDLNLPACCPPQFNNP